jgi:hypothetical protein
MINSKSELLSLPAYEKAFYEEKDPVFRKKIAIKILFLYKQFGMNNDFIYFYHHNQLEILPNVKDEILSKIANDLRIKPIDLNKIITTLFTRNIELDKFREFLNSSENQPVGLFLFYFLMKLKPYDELLNFIDSIPESTLTGHLRLHLIAMDPTKNLFEYLLYLDDKDDLMEKDLALNLYLYGLGLRNRGNFTHSARLLSTSFSFRKNEKVKREIAKSLVLSGRVDEACKLESWKPKSQYDIEELLYHRCSKNTEWLDYMKPKILQVANKDSLKLYEKIFN